MISAGQVILLYFLKMINDELKEKKTSMNMGLIKMINDMIMW